MSEETWGILGSKLAAETLVGQIKAQRAVFDRMMRKLVAGEKVALNPRAEEVEWVIKIYDYILKDPKNFKIGRVKNMLAGLPNSLGGKYVIPTKELAIHMEVASSYRDYSSILPDGATMTYFPVKVVRPPHTKVWLDVVVERAVNGNHDVVSLERKNGVYVHCVGWASTPGGSVHACEFKDGIVDVSDAPKFRCKECNSVFIKERKKAHKNGGSSSIISDKAMDDVLNSILG
jgi:hypothetical protein